MPVTVRIWPLPEKKVLAVCVAASIRHMLVLIYGFTNKSTLPGYHRGESQKQFDHRHYCKSTSMRRYNPRRLSESLKNRYTYIWYLQC